MSGHEDATLYSGSNLSEQSRGSFSTITSRGSRNVRNPEPLATPEQLCDLHVYKVPLELWRTPLNNILNQAVTDTISLGIIRVPPDLQLIDVRAEIQKQLEELAPKDYVFLRSVGRSITRLKSRQEYKLKAKHFLPPVHYAPELFLLEATPDIRDALAISDRSSQQSPSSLQHGSPGGRSYRDGYRSYRDRNGYPGDPRSRQQPISDRASPVRYYSPLPRINPSSPTHSREATPNAFVTDSYSNHNSHHPHQYQQHHEGGSPPPPAPSQRQAYPDSQRRPPFSESHNFEEDEDGSVAASRRQISPSREAEARAWGQPPQADAYDKPPLRAPAAAASPDRSPVASPTRKPAAGPQTYRAADGYERDAAYTNNTNEDSGVAGLTPDDQYKNRDKENYYDALNSKSRDLHNRLDRDRLALDDDDDDERRRLQELEDGATADRSRWGQDEAERKRRAEEDRRRQQQEEEARKRRQREEEEEELRRRAQEEQQEERRREEEEERRRREEEEARFKGGPDEDLNKFPSPPPLRLSSAELEGQRDTESARHRRKEERQRLLAELEDARELRHSTEKEREELVKKAKNLQNKTQNRRNHARDVWKKRYFEEKKKTPPLEEQTHRLQEELEALHRKLMAALEGPKDKGVRLGDNRPSQKNNYVIQCTKLQHDIDDMKRRVENAKMKLTAEMKLRNQAEAELRALRAELVQKKINLSLTRSQQFAALSPGMQEPDPDRSAP